MPDSYYDQSYASIIFHTLLHSNHEGMCTGGEGGGEGGTPGNSWWGVLSSSPNPHSISDQKMSFLHPFSELASKSHTRFQTWPLRDYVMIITWLSLWPKQEACRP